mmetsp:Transcript_17219/g.25832  ORF Transcript_17219/g.25832 Transcript_17219/m.25832 type:complete len:149 (+) Transcript_17219:465-911(+)
MPTCPDDVKTDALWALVGELAPFLSPFDSKLDFLLLTNDLRKLPKAAPCSLCFVGPFDDDTNPISLKFTGPLHFLSHKNTVIVKINALMRKIFFGLFWRQTRSRQLRVAIATRVTCAFCPIHGIPCWCCGAAMGLGRKREKREDYGKR